MSFLSIRIAGETLRKEPEVSDMNAKVAGIDVGVRVTKVVVLRGDDIVYRTTFPTPEKFDAAGTEQALGSALGESPSRVVLTGRPPSAELPINYVYHIPMLCLGRGAKRVCASAHTVIDVGAEATTVISLDDRGRIREAMLNDKCAAGGGIFFETMARRMQITVPDMARLGLQAREHVAITNTCTVFAEQEVLTFLYEDPRLTVSDVVAAIYASFASRVAGLVRRVGIQRDVLLVGGVAKSDCLVQMLQHSIGEPILVPPDSQFVSALGAAILGLDSNALSRRLQ